MSFKVGGSPAIFADNQTANSAAPAPPAAAPQTREVPERYAGGTLPVDIKQTDSQRTFVHRALAAHATAAGLGAKDAKEFADAWTSKETTFNHRASGQSVPYTAKEFRDLKAKGSTTFDLTKEFDREILADLNARVDAITIEDDNVLTVETSVKMTAQERGAYQAKLTHEAQQAKAALDEKPLALLTDGVRKDGKPLDADTALGRYIEKNYNQNGRVWGDKTNEMVAAAKREGVAVELQFNDDGTAAVSVSGADKQKLDRLFKDALNQTITGEQASIKGQQEATNQVVDTGKMYVNGAVNTINHITEPARGVLEAAGVDTSAAKLPKLEYNSEIGKKYGAAGEMGTELGILGMTAPAALRTTAGKIITGASGVYNVSTGAAGVDPTEKDAQGNARQLSPLERGVRIGGGLLEVVGARPAFGEAGAATSKTARQTEEVVEAVTNEGVVVRTKVPTTNAASEAATARPAQTADELNSKIVTVDSNGNPSGTRFRSDYEAHIKTREFSKASQRSGVNGCHDMKELEQYDIAVNSTLSKDSIKITSKTPHPTVKGVYKVEYQMPLLDNKGQLTGAWRNKKGSDSFVKTVYDSSVIPDAQMAQWGREAFADAVQKGTINITNRSWEGTASNGVKLGGHLDAQNNSVRTFFVEF